jgi:hypothetical protein
MIGGFLFGPLHRLADPVPCSAASSNCLRPKVHVARAGTGLLMRRLFQQNNSGTHPDHCDKNRSCVVEYNIPELRDLQR